MILSFLTKLPEPFIELLLLLPELLLPLLEVVLSVDYGRTQLLLLLQLRRLDDFQLLLLRLLFLLQLLLLCFESFLNFTFSFGFNLCTVCISLFLELSQVQLLRQLAVQFELYIERLLQRNLHGHGGIMCLW